MKAVIIPLGSRSLNLEVTSITVQNQDIDLDVAYDEKQVIVSVKAASDILDKLTVGDISATIDLKDLGAGDYTVPVSVTLPDGYAAGRTGGTEPAPDGKRKNRGKLRGY